MAVTVSAGRTGSGDGRAPEPPAVPVEQIETGLLLEGVAQTTGIDFRGFDPPLVHRRIARFMAEEKLPTISAVQDQVLHDRAACRRFMMALAQRGASLFADFALFRAVRERIVALLRTYPLVRVWQVGCSTGEDAYALAMLLEEEGLYQRCKIYATDIVEGLVETARAGAYDPAELERWRVQHAASGGKRALEEFLKEVDGRLVVGAALRKNIVFAQHNIASDASFNEFQLIVSRGAIAQFTTPVQWRIHGVLFESLSRLGFLALGPDESLRLTPHESSYREFDRTARIYRRVR